MQYSWKLAVSTFNLLDRLKICSFFLNSNNYWTQDKYVREFEKKGAAFVGCRYAILVSSGSAANQLIANYVKDRWTKDSNRNQVILNSVTWQSNCSVWIREGFQPIFLDANLEDFSLNYNQLINYLKKNHSKVAAVFPTAVLGYVPNMKLLHELEDKYPEIKFCMDNCENFFGRYRRSDCNLTNVSSHFTSSTSGFIAHHWAGGTECGLIFTNSKEEYEYFVMSRAHGLRRNLLNYGEYKNSDLNKYTNPLVHSQFDFQTLSSNYRSSDITAFISLLDYNKWNNNIKKRKELYDEFYCSLDLTKFILPDLNRLGCDDVAFCLPIVLRQPDTKLFTKIKYLLDRLSIESRPFISGNMLRQENYRQYGDYKKFSNAEHLNNFGMYIGLHTKLKSLAIAKLCDELNRIV